MSNAPATRHPDALHTYHIPAAYSATNELLPAADRVILSHFQCDFAPQEGGPHYVLGLLVRPLSSEDSRYAADISGSRVVPIYLTQLQLDTFRYFQMVEAALARAAETPA